jgi:hypothetical protein
MVLLSLLFSCGAAHAQIVFYTFEDALASEPLKQVLTSPTKLYFGEQGTPPLAEKARPDTYNRSASYSRFYNSDSREGCLAAFARTLSVMIEEATLRGYDSIVNIRGTADNKEGNYTPTGFACDAGRATSAVLLVSEFAVTQAAAQLAEEIERDPSRWVTPKRTKPPTRFASSLPLGTVLSSPEAKAILGPIKLHWGLHHAPAYSERFGPDSYRGEGDVSDYGTGACKQAVLDALSRMVEDVKEGHYDAIINLRSYLEEQPARKDSEYECLLSRKYANVQLLGSLVKLK